MKHKISEASVTSGEIKLTALVDIPNFFCTNQNKLQHPDEPSKIAKENQEHGLYPKTLRNDTHYQKESKL